MEQVVLRNIYVHTYKYMHLTTIKKRVMNLKTSKNEYVGVIRGRKGKGKGKLYYYLIK